MDSTKKTWDIWEIIAIKYLQKNGYDIIDTNFKFWRLWEIDIIAKLDNLTVFFEVKYRENLRFWTPEEWVTKSKLRKFWKTIDYYCFKNRVNHEFIRFDIIAILKGENSYKVTHYKNQSV
jgi:putative endonuclease